MKFPACVAAITFAGCLFVVPAAHACGNGRLLYQDNFQTLDPSWNAPSWVTATGGAMDIKLNKGAGTTLISQANIYTQPIEICATAKLISGPGGNGASPVVGLAFWADSANHFTLVETAPASGTASAWLLANTWKQLVGWRFVPGQNATVGGTNDLDLVIKGPSVAFMVNDKPAVVVIGTPPAAGWLVGLHLEAGNSEPSEWQITSFEVREAQ